MTNPFRDQEKFMKACGQSVDKYNQQQYLMYVGLIEEESKEFDQALLDNDRVEQLDALIDILVVTIGAIHSGGFDKDTGLVRKREDGKVLKPIGWTAPELAQFIKGE